jgi:hypothetical protein
MTVELVHVLSSLHSREANAIRLLDNILGVRFLKLEDD